MKQALREIATFLCATQGVVDCVIFPRNTINQLLCRGAKRTSTKAISKNGKPRSIWACSASATDKKEEMLSFYAGEKPK
jgi:hypothetical protein